jgi:copper oxidase (laccase) domain-containing protein
MLLSPLPENRVIAAWSQTSDGNMAHRFGPASEVNANRARFLNALALTPDDCVRLAVTQGTAARIREVDRNWAGISMRGGDPELYCDAYITSQPGLALWLLVADCLPLMIFDPDTPRIALAHCGFISTDLQLAKKVVERMRDLGSNPSHLKVVLGPGIKAASYVFDREHMKETGPEWGPFLAHPDPDHTSIDNFGYNVVQLTAAGVSLDNIHISQFDTGTAKEFYSHVRSWRTSQPEGRFAAVIALK